MARMMKVYKVGIGEVLNDGEDVPNMDSTRVMATDAEAAIKKARKEMPRRQYIESVELISVVDVV